MSQPYVIKPVFELFKIINQEEVINETQLEHNEAFVYELANPTRIILIPNVGSEGILFFERASFQKMVDSKKFPVKDEDNDFAMHVDEMLNVEANVLKFRDQLEKMLDVRIELSSDAKNLDLISDAIDKSVTEDDKKKLFIPLGIVFHEILRLEIKGHWGLDKEYTLNPYFIPFVTDSKNRTYKIWPRLAVSLRQRNFSSRKFWKEINRPLN